MVEMEESVEFMSTSGLRSTARENACDVHADQRDPRQIWELGVPLSCRASTPGEFDQKAGRTAKTLGFWHPLRSLFSHY